MCSTHWSWHGSTCSQLPSSEGVAQLVELRGLGLGLGLGFGIKHQAQDERGVVWNQRRSDDVSLKTAHCFKREDLWLPIGPAENFLQEGLYR
jgi:hypothetical protein